MENKVLNENLENTVEYTRLNKIIECTKIVSGKFRDGRRFRFIPTEDIYVFDQNITDDEWNEYLSDKETGGNNCELSSQTFEASHFIGRIPKGTPDWKHICLKFKEQYPEEV